MSRPLLLDLFCCAGGASVGYERAGFRVIGVDLEPQPNYPFEFVQMDALEVLKAGRVGIDCNADPYFDWSDVAAVHASPPCQSFTAYRRKGHGVGDGYPDLIAPVRALLRELGYPYVIENVAGAPLHDALRLCGSSFGLDVRRHRYFESNRPLMGKQCDHASQKPGRFPGATNRAPMSRATCEVGVWRIPLEQQKTAMGVDWDVTLPELSEAIPPAYTHFIGLHLKAQIDALTIYPEVRDAA